MLRLAELFYSVQGEGTFVGTPAVFIRLAGCNLACHFCDTDYSLKFLADVDAVVNMVNEKSPDCPMVVITGGEPTTQVEVLELIRALQSAGKRVHIESNGTVDVSGDLSGSVWLTVSPKERLSANMALRANEVKLIVDGEVPFGWLEKFPNTTPLFLQPEGNKRKNIAIALDAVKQRPERLRLSLQTHKFIGVR